MASSPPPAAKPASIWRQTVRLTLVLLALWASVSVGAPILFVDVVNQVRIGRIPLGFWIAQQGAIYVFVVLIFVYAWRMDRIERASAGKGGSKP